VIRVTYVKQNAIQPANLEFNAEGTPVSRDFDDVYFSNDNGLEETRYVFLGGNQLSARFPPIRTAVCGRGKRVRYRAQFPDPLAGV
jgi:tRNA U34 5-methylaminomethyl-2-thiouridine-forming methyltransferase MnmC